MASEVNDVLRYKVVGLGHSRRCACWGFSIGSVLPTYCSRHVRLGNPDHHVLCAGASCRHRPVFKICSLGIVHPSITQEHR